MKKIIMISALFTMLVACGDDKQASNGNNKPAASKAVTKINKQEKLLACSVLDENYIKSNYSGATDIKLKEGGRSYPLCSANFTYYGIDYGFSLTLGIIGGADESYLESSVSYFKGKNQIETITGVGEKAYNRTSSGQISALSGGNLIHVTVYNGMDYDLELTKKLANDMFAILAK